MWQPPPKQAATQTLDVVYPIRPGNQNPELMFSLRSLEANFPHAQVWTVGYKPTWLRGTNHIAGNTQKVVRANLWHNLLAACSHPDIGDTVVLMNDDFYFTQPITTIPVHFRGPLRDHNNLPRVARGDAWWRDSLRTTLICLQANGHPDPISYELHIPFVVNKHAMRDILERFKCVTPDNPPQWRTLYGVLNEIGGTQAGDVKVYRPGPVGSPFHSTDDQSFRHFREWFNKTFPEPCRYENSYG